MERDICAIFDCMWCVHQYMLWNSHRNVRWKKLLQPLFAQCNNFQFHVARYMLSRNSLFDQDVCSYNTRRNSLMLLQVALTKNCNYTVLDLKGFSFVWKFDVEEIRLRKHFASTIGDRRSVNIFHIFLVSLEGFWSLAFLVLCNFFCYFEQHESYPCIGKMQHLNMSRFIIRQAWCSTKVRLQNYKRIKHALIMPGG